ncbi:TPA: hypothetical protein ACG0AN_001328 [Enterobacter kobei]
MVVTSALLICDCGSMDISIIDITVDGVTEQYYHCNDCGNEWPVNMGVSTDGDSQA